MTVDIQVVTQTGLTLLVVICIGFLAQKLGFMDKTLTQKLSTFTMCVAQPCMLFTSISGAPYSRENLKTGFFVLLLAFCVHVVMALMARGTVCFYRDPDEKKITQFSLLFVNCAFVGYPILEAAFGDIGRFWGAFWVICFNMLIWTLGIVIIGRGRDDIKMNFKKVFLNYGTVPCVVGLLAYIVRLPVPAVLMEGMSYVGGLCTPVALLVIGANLARIPLKSLFCDWKLYYFAVMRLLVFPLAITLLCRLAGLGDTWCLFCCVMAALPTAANTVMFAEMYDVRPDIAARTVGIAAFLSMLTIPLSVYLANVMLKLFSC